MEIEEVDTSDSTKDKFIFYTVIFSEYKTLFCETARIDCTLI